MKVIISSIARAAPALLLLASAAFAEPVGTFKLRDGRTLVVEMRGYSNGGFTGLDVIADQPVTLRDEDVRSIDFGDRPLSAGGVEGGEGRAMRALTWFMLRRDFAGLAAICGQEFRSNGPARLKVWEERIAKRLQEAAPARTAEAKTEMRLAQVIIAATLGEKERAGRLMAGIQADRPNDPVVAKFMQDVQFLRDWQRRAAQPVRPVKERP